MSPFRKILVATDFSEQAGEAIRAAAELSRRYEASVTLVHVFEPIAYTLPEAYVLASANQLATLTTQITGLLAEAAGLAERSGATRVTSVQLQGSPAHEIATYAKKEGFDLIVAGTHGRKGLGHMLIGSVAERIVRFAPCPVLVVRPPDANAK